MKQTLGFTCFLLVFVIRNASNAAQFDAETIKSEAIDNCLRGEREDLQLILRGAVIRADGAQEQTPSITAESISVSDKHSIAVLLNGSTFELAIPIIRRPHNLYGIRIHAASADGIQVASEFVPNHSLRQKALDGLTIRLSPSTRMQKLSVLQSGKPIADANVDITTTTDREVLGKTNSAGEFVVQRSKEERLKSGTAWTDSFAFGSAWWDLSENELPDNYTIDLYSCRTQRVLVIDENQKPVPNLKFKLHVTPFGPEFLGGDSFNQSMIQTDGEGLADFKWFPEYENPAWCVELPVCEWELVGDDVFEGGDRTIPSEFVDGKIVIPVKAKTPRKRVQGTVVSSGTSVAGFYVELWSFQSGKENRSDAIHAFTDRDGHFFVDVLPNSKYCAFVNDQRWVSGTIDLIPSSSSDEITNEPLLTATGGIPVKVVLTQGSNKKPMVHQWVGLESPHHFSWTENGQMHRGTSGRRVYEFSDQHGLRIGHVAPGKLKVSVYSPEWQTEKTFQVQPDADNTFSIHRPIGEARELRGSLIPAENVKASFANAEIKLGSMDGETDEKFELTSDKTGGFQCKSMSNEIGAFASTSDGEFAGFGMASNFEQIFEITMRPTIDYHGMLIDLYGDPIVNHPVEVSICVADQSIAETAAREFCAKKVKAMTDSAGRYTLSNLPSNMRLDIAAGTLDRPEDISELLNRVSLQASDDRPIAINRLKSAAEKKALKPLATRFKERLRDSQLGKFRVLAIVSNDTHTETRNFIDEHFVSYSRMKEVMSFMPLEFQMNESAADADIQFASQMDWPHVAPRSVFVCAYDDAGAETERIFLTLSDEDVSSKAKDFLTRNCPSPCDANSNWIKVFDEAKRTNKRVWVRVSGRYCGPCFVLARWIDDHKDLLSKDFLFLKVDDVMDLNGREVAERLVQRRNVGIPFHGIFNVNQELLIDSIGPIGNIGAMSGFEGKLHLEKMLKAGCVALTDQDIHELVDSIQD